jgi:rubredoxin
LVSKCANPTCFTPFRYLHQGRLYKLRLAHERKPANGHGVLERIEHYWLCPECSRSLTVAVEAGKAITRPLQRGPACGRDDGGAPEYWHFNRAIL